MLMNDEIIHCFWTGGWDSTFRILFIIFIEKKQVLPYYIIDEKRVSTRHELNVMSKIRSKLKDDYPGSSERLLDTHISKRSNIKKYSGIRKQYKKIANQVHIGIQYEWLARFAYQHQLNEIELCFIKHPDEFISALDKLMRPNTIGVGHDCRMVENPEFSPLKMFQFFRFPVYHLKKTDMLDIAKRNNFLELMKLTWYCHNPDENGNPCGKCRPCLIAERSGYIHNF